MTHQPLLQVWPWYNFVKIWLIWVHLSVVLVRVSNFSLLGINEAALSSELRRDYDELLHKVGCCGESSVGRVIVAGSKLPSHSDINISCLSNQRIKVNACLLLLILIGNIINISSTTIAGVKGTSQHGSWCSHQYCFIFVFSSFVLCYYSFYQP